MYQKYQQFIEMMNNTIPTKKGKQFYTVEYAKLSQKIMRISPDIFSKENLEKFKDFLEQFFDNKLGLEVNSANLLNSIDQIEQPFQDMIEALVNSQRLFYRYERFKIYMYLDFPIMNGNCKWSDLKSHYLKIQNKMEEANLLDYFIRKLKFGIDLLNKQDMERDYRMKYLECQSPKGAIPMDLFQ